MTSGRYSRVLSWIVLLALATPPPGCVTLVTQMEEPTVFGGVEGHVALHRDVRVRDAFWYPLLLLDIPFSLAADVVFFPATLASDVSWEQATDVPLDEEHLIVVHARVLDLPAAHMSFVIKKGEEWNTVEMSNARSPTAPREGEEVSRGSEVEIRPGASSLGQHRIIGVLTGDEAREAIKVLERLAEEYRSDDSSEAGSRNAYRAWPGPNSNTFVDRLSRELPHLAFEFHHLAVGKDYTPFVRVGRTTTKTGVELETALVGVQAGLREGVEIHVVQLTLGFSFWPPALKVPFQERLGFSQRWKVEGGRWTSGSAACRATIFHGKYADGDPSFLFLGDSVEWSWRPGWAFFCWNYG